jgi:hypothetical protein
MLSLHYPIYLYVMALIKDKDFVLQKSSTEGDAGLTLFCHLYF